MEPVRNKKIDTFFRPFGRIELTLTEVGALNSIFITGRPFSQSTTTANRVTLSEIIYFEHILSLPIPNSLVLFGGGIDDNAFGKIAKRPERSNVQEISIHNTNESATSLMKLKDMDNIKDITISEDHAGAGEFTNTIRSNKANVSIKIG